MNLSIKKAVSKIFALGARAVLIKARQKRPFEKHWQNKEPTQNDVETHVARGGNVGIVLGTKSEGLGDVDLDAPEARLLSRAFLPKTGLISGRASSRSSHWWYRLSPAGPTKKFKDPDLPSDDERKVLVELRCEGGQTVVPPSVHESGEPIEWEQIGDPTLVSWDELLVAVRWLAIASLLVRVWTVGDRNDIALAVTGWLLSFGHHPDEVEHLVSQVAEAAGDEEAEDRARIVQYTVDRMAKGGTCYGLTKLSELIGEPKAKKLSEWLPKADRAGDDDDDDQPFPAPLGIQELLDLSELEIEWRVVGLMELGDKVLIAAYSKTHKTNLALELAVAVATATPFVNKFEVPQRGRVGLVMMEDAPRHLAKRLSRLALGRGCTLEDLEGSVYVWPRPPLVLTLQSVEKLRRWVDALELDMIVVDNFALVSRGNSNNADDVTPQLVALSELTRNRPGLVVVLVHHGKKLGADGGNRLTDIIRGSGAFTAWYTCGVFLARKDEDSPVDVRIELRNLPAPPSFKFDVTDEHPGDSENGTVPRGWFRLYVVEGDMKDSKTTALEAAVLDYLRKDPGCSRTKLRDGVVGKGTQVDRTFKELCKEGRARFEKSGRSHKCYALDDEGEIDDTPPY